MSVRDRDGSLIEPQQAGDDPWHDPRCSDGWLPETLDERPVPCLVCRPNLRRDAERRRAAHPRALASPDVREAAMTAIRAALAESRRRAGPATAADR